MSDQNDDDKGASEELKEGFRHFFSAARKLAKGAEPTVSKSLDEAERVLGKLGRGGEVVASEMGREMASFATRVADRLRNATDREERKSSPAPARDADGDVAPGESAQRDGDKRDPSGPGDPAGDPDRGTG